MPNGAYYARVRSGGKLVRKALGTSSFSTAKLLLLDFTRTARTKPEPSSEPIPSLTFSQAREIYRRWLATDLTLKPKSLDYRELCLQKTTTSATSLRRAASSPGSTFPLSPGGWGTRTAGPWP